MEKQNPKPNSGATGLSPRLIWGALIVAMAAFGWAVFTPPERGGDASAAMAADPAQIEWGKALFAKNCAVCHGPQASGQEPDSPMGGKTDEGAILAPALNGTGHAWHHRQDALFDKIQNGSRTSDSPMPAFKGSLGDVEIRDLLAYIFSLWPPKIKALFQ